MYKKVTIENFRGIKHLEIEDFRQVNLFVGKNNCGKTTILESLFLLINPTNAELPLKINRFRGLDTVNENLWRLIFNKLNVDTSIKISSELKTPKEKRSLIIKPNIKSVSNDTITKTTIDKKAVDIKDSYSGLSPVIDGLILECSIMKDGEEIPKKIKTKIIMRDLGLEIKVPKHYKEPLSGVFIDSKTIFGNIGGRFDNIQIEKQMDRIIKILGKIEPSLDNLLLGAHGIIYCDIGLDRLIPLNVMGGGMFRLLSIILAISDTQNGIVLIDEIENGFHHSSQEILWNAVFESAKEFNVQIFAATHSLECVKAFSSSYSRVFRNKDNIRLYRIEREDDNFDVVSYDHKTLEATLDSEWEMR